MRTAKIATAYAFSFSFDTSVIALHADWNPAGSVVALAKLSSSIIVPNAAPFVPLIETVCSSAVRFATQSVVPVFDR